MVMCFIFRFFFFFFVSVRAERNVKDQQTNKNRHMWQDIFILFVRWIIWVLWVDFFFCFYICDRHVKMRRGRVLLCVRKKVLKFEFEYDFFLFIHIQSHVHVCMWFFVWLFECHYVVLKNIFWIIYPYWTCVCSILIWNTFIMCFIEKSLMFVQYFLL